MKITPYLIEFCRLFVFTVLLFASLGKGRTFRKFRENLTDAFRIPKAWITVLTVLIIMLEGLLAIIIFLNNELIYSAMLCALITFAGFTLFISITVIQDRLVRCNCFGQSEDYISYLDIIRNVILLLACGFFLHSYHPISVVKPIQFLLFGLALIPYLVITNLKNISTVTHDPKKS